ncbi:MAG TPA: hypothetical protein VHO84_16830 [Syntrophorhabdaceae bacterium]|nr:hypothetical protein [Syntrophorhabdaceae bacterium]
MNKKLLIVDDDSDNHHMRRSPLKGKGLDIVMAQNIRHALGTV